MARSDTIGARELFNELNVTNKKVADLLTESVRTLEKHNNSIEELREVVRSKLWWFAWTCLFIAAASIGVKLVYP